MNVKKNPILIGIIFVFAAIFFLQGFSFIISNEMNGIHFGKRRLRLAPPVKQAVALQMKFDSLEDISFETESDKSENPNLKVYGFFRRPVVENIPKSFSSSKKKIISSSAPPLFTLYRIFRI